MVTQIPTESIICLALVKPRSKLARTWNLEKPAYCIYEYDRAFGTREIRWGDGSGQEIGAAEHDDLILLTEFDEKKVNNLYAC